MKQILLLLLIVIIAIVTIRFFVGGNEDTWLCQDNVWIQHGQPSSPKPTTGCGEVTTSPTASASAVPSASPTGESARPGLANPASVYCLEQGGKLEITPAENGALGMCTLPSGKVCEEWANFRKECQ